MASNSRIAVVTGANKGIGYFIALQLGLSGLFSKIILGCRDATRGTLAATQLQQTLADTNENTSTELFRFVPLTIGDPNSHSDFCKTMQEEFGKVDVLVNNAGFAYKNADPTPFEGQTHKTLEINYYGLVDFTEKMMPLLRKGDDPRLVNVASRSGRLGQVSRDLQDAFTDKTLTIPKLNALIDEFKDDVRTGVHRQKGWSNTNYGISKLGVIAATRVWARQEAALSSSSSNIKVNSCCPGYCDTDMTSHKGPRPANEGAKNAVIPATMDNPPTGAFFSNFGVAEW